MIATDRPNIFVPANTRRALKSGTPLQGLPSDLVRQATRRLRAMALLYAFVFFMAGIFPALIHHEGRQALTSSPWYWAPGFIAIATALVVAAIICNPRFSVTTLFTIGIAFEIASAYGIAAAEFLGPAGLEFSHTWNGLSWVAVWVLIFSVVVPTSPRKALVAGLLAVTAVPAMVALSVWMVPPSMNPGLMFYFFTFVFPYLLVVLMAYVGAEVLYSLGTEVRKARDLGSYHLLERIGVGGMGEVWRARHQLLARPAAIKLIRPSVTVDGAEGARRRFEREAQAIASLRSPHTVNLFDFGISGDGTFYYVMELLEGLDTERMVKEFGPLPAERVVHVVRQLCHSLSEAESVGLVHRDIKPANIVLCRYGEDYDFVKVLDFGIAKAMRGPADNPEDAATMGVTMANVVQGTPAFIAPEQALGETSVDHRADIYATGCLAYWLLTGQLVFTADSPMRLIVHHANTTPDPPSSRTELPIPPALDRLVLDCLAKKPEDRPQTARELMRRLDAIQLHDSWDDSRAKRWWDVHQPISVAQPVASA